MSIRIARFTAQNAKGFESFDVECGDVVLFTGRNGEGKTSATDLLLAAFSTDKATNNRELLRVGAKEGFIQVELANEETGETWTIRRDLKPGEVSAPKIRSSKTGPVRAYGTFLEGIADLVSMDPFRKAMSVSPKEQAEILLRTMPLRTTGEELQAAAPGWVNPRQCSPDANAVDLIDSLHDRIYEERTGLNRVVKEKRHAVAEWESTLEQTDAGQEEELTNLRNQERDIAARLSAIKDKTNRKAQELRELAHSEFTQRKLEWDQRFQKAIDRINVARLRKIEELSTERDANLAEVTRTASEFLEEQTAGLNGELQFLAGRIGQTEQKVRAADRAAAQKVLIERTRQEAEAREAEAEELTASLKRLDCLKAKLLEQLPIKGLKIERGRAYLDGVPLEEVNRAQQGLFWIRVAVQRAIERDLGVVVIDDAEKFDDINFPKIVEAAKQSPVQFFIGRVEPHEFRVESL